MTNENQKSTAELVSAAQDALYEAAFRTEDFGVTEMLLAEARAAAIAEDDRLAESVILYLTGMWLHYQALDYLFRDEKVPEEDIATEQAVFQEALDLGRLIERETGDAVGTARPQFGLGLVHQVLRGDWETALPYFRGALDLTGAVEAAGDLYSCSEFHRHIGFYYGYADVQHDKAIEHLSASLDYRLRMDDLKVVPSALLALGEAESAAGHHDRAIDLLRQAVQASKDAGVTPARVKFAEDGLREAERAAAGSAEG